MKTEIQEIKEWVDGFTDNTTAIQIKLILSFDGLYIWIQDKVSKKYGSPITYQVLCGNNKEFNQNSPKKRLIALLTSVGIINPFNAINKSIEK